jgi:hypothetical protein
MTRRTTAVLVSLSLCLAAGCNRGSNNSAGAGNKGANAAAPAANASTNTGATAATPGASQARLSLQPGGLEAEAAGRKSPLNFGSSISEALTGLTAMFGPPLEDATNSECGGGEAVRIIRWSNGLRILAQGDRFLGWETDQPGLSAPGGLHVGMTRTELEANPSTFEQTSLGTEWMVGDGEVNVRGLFSDNTPGARVTHMWAGITCHMT